MLIWNYNAPFSFKPSRNAMKKVLKNNFSTRSKVIWKFSKERLFFSAISERVAKTFFISCYKSSKISRACIVILIKIDELHTTIDKLKLKIEWIRSTFSSNPTKMGKLQSILEWYHFLYNCLYLQKYPF